MLLGEANLTPKDLQQKEQEALTPIAVPIMLSWPRLATCATPALMAQDMCGCNLGHCNPALLLWVQFVNNL